MSFSFGGDLKNVLLSDVDSIVPGTTIASDTTTDGNAVDAVDSDDHITAVFLIGNSGDGSTTVSLRIVESDTSGGSYTLISGAQKDLGASATANDNTVHFISTRLRSKRWLKARVVTAGGGTPSVPVAAAFLLRKKITGTGTGYVT